MVSVAPEGEGRAGDVPAGRPPAAPDGQAAAGALCMFRVLSGSCCNGSASSMAVLSPLAPPLLAALPPTSLGWWRRSAWGRCPCCLVQSVASRVPLRALLLTLWEGCCVAMLSPLPEPLPSPGPAGLAAAAPDSTTHPAPTASSMASWPCPSPSPSSSFSSAKGLSSSDGVQVPGGGGCCCCCCAPPSARLLAPDLSRRSRVGNRQLNKPLGHFKEPCVGKQRSSMFKNEAGWSELMPHKPAYVPDNSFAGAPSMRCRLVLLCGQSALGLPNLFIVIPASEPFVHAGACKRHNRLPHPPESYLGLIDVLPQHAGLLPAHGQGQHVRCSLL